jgi:hypothetical protein
MRDNPTTCALVLAAVLGCIISGSPGQAQPAPSLTDQIAAWEALPEDPAMRGVCAHYLTYATSISSLLAKHASSAEITQWANREIAQDERVGHPPSI